MNDYPRVRVLAFERLPIPEAVDELSEAAAERWLARRRNEPDGGDLRQRGINMTPAIDEACNRPDVRTYLEQLAQLVGHEVEPSKLRPPWPAYRMFRRTHMVGDTGLCLSLHDSDPTPDGERVSQVQVYCEGPNMGSAGGPTLQELGPIAQIRYRGVLMVESRPVGP